MRKLNKRAGFIPVIVLALLLAACGPLDAFKSAFSATRPLVQSLVTSGVLTQGKADVVVRDIGDGVNAATRADGCVKAIVVTGPEKKVAKAKCYLALSHDLREILNHHNFGGAPLLDQISMIVEGAIAAFEGYYTTATQGMARASRGVGGPAEDPDKKLEVTLKDLNKQLKALTKN